MIMPSHNENLVKSKLYKPFNHNNNHTYGYNKDEEEDHYLAPHFDNEILDLDEEQSSDDEPDLHDTCKESKYFNNKRTEEICIKKKSNYDSCTTMGTNCLGKKVVVLLFSVEAVLRKDCNIRKIGEKYNLSYKVYKTDCKLLKTILNSHGFQECQSYNNDYNLLWTGGHVRPYTLRTMSEFQKINHFPRSYELTRKDRLFKNIQKMQQLKGLKHFDFVPSSYLIPSEFQELCQNFSKEKSTYIVKPVALSRGRGIFLSNHPGQIPLDEPMIASRYISNPFLINDFKFDIRMYVLVTSFDPLVAYLYEEGLTRFATVKYQNIPKNLKSQCMHLTNYSVNRKNDGFIHNDDADVEDFGNKWSLGALLRYLKSKNIDTACLMMKIEDIIIKSLIAVESPIASTCRMYQAYPSNCFELFGYDIIIDENLRPWLLEVNLSPSLSCDSPLDFKIKSHMMSDMFSLIGISCEDPIIGNPNQSYSNSKTRPYSSMENKISKQINNQNSSIRRPTAGLRRRDISTGMAPFKSDQLRMIRRVKEEYKRKGGWLRIFPTLESFETYFHYFQSHSSDQSNMSASNSNQMNLNKLLYFKLYPNQTLELDSSNRTNSQNSSSYKSRVSLHSVNYSSSFHNGTLSQLLPSSQMTYKRISQNYSDTQSRLPYYERKLGEDAIITDKGGTNSSVEKIENIKSSTNEMKAFNNQDSDNEIGSPTSSISISEKEDNSDLEIDASEEDCTSTNSHNIPSSMSQSSKDVLSIENLIQSGGKLTKIQARMTFSAYLTRVQRRLLIESRSEESNDVSVKENNSHEQLELVLRFLRRAASNMPSDEFVISSIPDKSQPFSKRQEWLSKLLGNFIKIYSRETSIADAKQKELQSYVDKKTFLSFLRLASESELEQTLSNYTRVNKSAGIFLNPNLSSQSSHHEEKPKPPPVGLYKSVSMNNLSVKDKTSLEYNQKSQQSISKPLITKTQSSLQINKDHTPQKQSPVDQQAFSTISVNQTPWRPGSTKLTGNNPRPVSSSVIHNRSKLSTKNEKSYDPDAISKALQRLAVDQRNRQLNSSAFSFYDSYMDQKNSMRRSTDYDPLTQTLMRQYHQSKKLLQESRAKHSALLLQNAVGNAEHTTNSNIRMQLVNKPPPGIRSSQTMKLPGAPRR